MNKKLQAVGLALLFAGFIGLLVVLMHGGTIAVLEPQGVIADKQRNLIYFAVGLSLIVVIPVFALFFYIIWKYRASNTSAKYSPEWDSNKTLESIWWGVPILLIIVLSVVTWNSTHELDPFKSLAADKKPMKIQVVALQWKWLFIYPEENIATVNYVQFPENTPIDFEITADAPMNSFWVPELGGQIYAMSGMSTHLNLKASQTGSFRGVSANISGAGFSGMKFTANASSLSDYDQWVESVRQSGATLDQHAYDELSQPSKDVPTSYFGVAGPRIYDTVLMKFISPPRMHTGSVDEHKDDHSSMGHEMETR